MAHQLNANQLFKWRRQFLRRQGRPEPAPELLPIEISSAAPGPASAVTSMPLAPLVGTIEVELCGAHVRITGQADPAAIRIVLASLRNR